MKIAVDFDGTIVEHKYPSIGKEKPFAVDTLKKLSEDGHQLILWTVRSGSLLDEAVRWCESRGLKFFAVNSNMPAGSLFEHRLGDSPKIVADVFIDDSNLGGIPDWGEIYEMITGMRHTKRKKRPWWKKLFRR